jgi:hypothetical protein
VLPGLKGELREIEACNLTLRLEGADVMDNTILEARYAGGCDDAPFGVRSGIALAKFERGAPSLLSALVSAIRDVERAAPSLKVVRVEADTLVTAAEIAAKIGRTPQSVSQYARGLHGPDDFPEPAMDLGGGRSVWRWSDVASWFQAAFGTAPDDLESTRTVSTVNAALELRRSSARPPVEARRDLEL